MSCYIIILIILFTLIYARIYEYLYHVNSMVSLENFDFTFWVEEPWVCFKETQTQILVSYIIIIIILSCCSWCVSSSTILLFYCNLLWCTSWSVKTVISFFCRYNIILFEKCLVLLDSPTFLQKNSSNINFSCSQKKIYVYNRYIY